MGTRNAAIAATTTCVLLALPATASAAPAATTWTGWDAPGPIGVGAPTQLAARGGTTALLGADVEADTASIAVTADTGARVGRVAVNAPPQQLLLALQRPGRLLLSDACRIRFSDDLGLTWSGERLPGCSTSDVPGVVVASDDVAFASTGSRTWRTVDGGATWTVASDAQAGPQVAFDAEVGLRIVAVGGAQALQRTVDGGATWGGVPLPAPDGGGTVDTRPTLTTIVRRGADGVVIAAGDQLLTSGDRGLTFSAVPVPVPDDLPGAAGVVADGVACDPTGACVVRVRDSAGSRTSALRFDGSAFGERVVAPPALDLQAPQPGVVVGLTSRSDGEARRSADLGATPYRTIASGAQPRLLGVHGMLAVAQTGRLHVSDDGGAGWVDVALPDTPGLTRVASLAGSLIALADNGKVLRHGDGAWTPFADVSSVKPRTLAVAGSTAIVVGDRGIVRLTPDGKVTPASGTVIAGRGFTGVAARGGTVVAWARGPKATLAVRSTNGGRTWKRSSLPKGVDDVQLVTAKVAYAIAGTTLHRSTNGGRTFRRRTVVPSLGSAGQASAADVVRPAIAFQNAVRGTLVTTHGAFYTGDGGKRLVALPTPGNQAPAAASLFGNGVLVQDVRRGTLLRAAGLLGRKQPSLTLRVHGKVKRRGRTRTVTVLGRIAGQPADSRVAVLSTDKAGATRSVEAVATTFADGSFRITAKLGAKDRGLQAWYGGAVRPEGTALGAVSKVLRVR